MSMKIIILAGVLVILAISQVQAFPQVAEGGVQIDFVGTVDNAPIQEVTYSYAKFLEAISRRPAPMRHLHSNFEMAEDQTTSVCPTANCSCNITLLILQGHIRDSNGRPTDNCTIYNVPYCEGVCSSYYR